MDIILSGGGDSKQTQKIDQLFSKRLEKDKPLLYIPVAMPKTSRSYEDCLSWLKNVFKPRGINQFSMIDEDDMKSFSIKDLEKYSGIYIGGGNTPYLLHTLRKTGFLSNIQYAIKQNIPLYGGSAGAAIFGKSIKTTLRDDENKVGIEDMSGLDILSGYSIYCHYDGNEEYVRRLMDEYRLENCIALRETNGLHVNDTKVEVIGKRNITVFRKDGSLDVEVGRRLL